MGNAQKETRRRKRGQGVQFPDSCIWKWRQISNLYSGRTAAKSVSMDLHEIRRLTTNNSPIYKLTSPLWFLVVSLRYKLIWPYHLDLS